MESRRSTKREPRLLRVSEVAEMLNVSKDTVYRAVHNNQLPHEMVFGMIRIPRSAVKRKLRDEEED
jgi:excisionase family DNA binding protein